MAPGGAALGGTVVPPTAAVIRRERGTNAPGVLVVTAPELAEHVA